MKEDPKEKIAEKKEAFAKYTAKDSVFTMLFRDKKYGQTYMEARKYTCQKRKYI